MSTTITRTDVHRPAELDPSQYEAVGYYYPVEVEDIETLATYWAVQHDLSNDDPDAINWGGVHGNNLNRCDHCGAHIKYGAELVYKPTGQHIHVGETCLGNRFGVESKEAFQAMRKAAKLNRERVAKKTKLASQLTENPRLAVVWRHRNETAPSFVVALLENFRFYGNLTDRQIAAVTKAWKKARFGHLKPGQFKAPAPAGRQSVSGVIVAVKEVVGYTGYTEHKLIVRDDRGFSVYMSTPKPVREATNELFYSKGSVFREAVVGKHIAFTADLTISDRDECFAFAKRPTKTVFEVAA